MTEELPPEWALKRAIELTSQRPEPWNMPTDAEKRAVHAFAFYIERHEQPPVDPDVFDVRAILAEYADCALVGSDAAQQLHDGRKDNNIGFINALNRFRFALNKRAAPTMTPVFDRLGTLYNNLQRNRGVPYPPPASNVIDLIEQIETVVKDMTAPKQPISHEQMTRWTRRLLAARWTALAKPANAQSVMNGTRDNEPAFVAVRAVLSEILAGQNFG